MSDRGAPILNFARADDAHRWLDDPWAEGAFAAFAPGQITALLPVIIRPEGRIHFAGEHCSLTHTWIEGAMQSSLKAVQSMLEQAQRS